MRNATSVSGISLEVSRGRVFDWAFVASPVKRLRKSAIRVGALVLRVFLRNPRRAGIHCSPKISRRDGPESAGVAPGSASGRRQWGSGRKRHLFDAPLTGAGTKKRPRGKYLVLLVQLKAPGATAERHSDASGRARGNMDNYCSDYYEIFPN